MPLIMGENILYEVGQVAVLYMTIAIKIKWIHVSKKIHKYLNHPNNLTVIHNYIN